MTDFVDENGKADNERPTKVLGRFWSRPDGASWAGFLDFGIFGRVKVLLVHNNRRRPDKMDSDLNLLVRLEDTILQQMFKFARERLGD